MQEYLFFYFRDPLYLAKLLTSFSDKETATKGSVMQSFPEGAARVKENTYAVSINHSRGGGGGRGGSSDIDN